ncbi:hypothetical protein Ddc_06526 [Ditylenchus destructor]|nr:hypothetical protein Ddc_06526 [Ditylenchus destructor]
MIQRASINTVSFHVPESGVDETFYEQQRFFFGGFHCTAWIKLYVLIAFGACFTFLETILEEATYMKAELYDLNRPFNGFMDLLIEWDRNSFSFWCMSVAAVLIAVILILILAMLFKNPLFLIPIQLATMTSFYTLLKRMFVTYIDNMSVSYELYRDMDEMLAHLQHYRSRDTWLSSRIDLHPKYEPLVRNGFLFAFMTLCLGIEYAVERSMQFYGYDEFLDKLNRPFVLVYRKWQFKRMMKRRKAHQMARLIRKHRNMNGNFTWAPAIAGNCSFQTAIENTSLLTAIELEDTGESITVPIKVNQSFLRDNRVRTEMTAKR